MEGFLFKVYLYHMKIVITESQLQTITLNEVKLKDGVREIYRDDNVVVSTRDGREVSERFTGNVQIYNITNQYIIILVEKGDEWGYRGEEEIEYDKAPIKPNSYSHINFIINPNKQKEGGYSKTNFNLTYFIKNNQKTVNVNYGWFSSGKKNNINKCKTDRGYDKLKLAVKWWKNWLNNDATKSKFGKSFNYDNKKVEYQFNIYNKLLDGIKLEYEYDTNRPNSAYVRPSLLQATNIREGGYFIPITINCAIRDSDIVSTMTHEIQHILADNHKLHPYSDNIFKFYNDMLFTDTSKELSSVKDKKSNLSNFLVNTGFKPDDVNDIIYYYEWRLENDVRHLMNPNEVNSELIETRKALNLKPGQDITLDMLIKNVDNNAVMMFINVWMYSKKSITEFLSYHNSLAKTTSPIDITGTSNLT
jgi:hypothetical protein